jgi:hypothetical protein
VTLGWFGWEWDLKEKASVSAMVNSAQCSRGAVTFCEFDNRNLVRLKQAWPIVHQVTPGRRSASECVASTVRNWLFGL